MKAPLFSLPTIDNQEIYHLKNDIGKKIIVLTFWASWCPDCSRDLPKKEQLYQTMDKNKVKMIAINVTGRERNRNEAEKFANKFLTQLTLKDNGREIYNQYECSQVPTTIIIDKQGLIFKKFGDKATILDIVQAIGQIMD